MILAYFLEDKPVEREHIGPGCVLVLGEAATGKEADTQGSALDLVIESLWGLRNVFTLYCPCTYRDTWLRRAPTVYQIPCLEDRGVMQTNKGCCPSGA